MIVDILPELQMGNFNKRLMLGFRRTVCIVTDGGGIAAVVADSLEWSMTNHQSYSQYSPKCLNHPQFQNHTVKILDSSWWFHVISSMFHELNRFFFGFEIRNFNKFCIKFTIFPRFFKKILHKLYFLFLR